MNYEYDEDIIVIGAGPAGLCLAYYLKKVGLSPLLLESGEVSESWKKMPDRLKLLSPWSANALFGEPLTLWDYFKKKPAKEFATYLSEWAAQEKIRIKSHSCVDALMQDSQGGWEVKTGSTTLRTRTVVCASGYFAKPYQTNFQGLKMSGIQTMHFAEYRNASQVRKKIQGVNSPTILIVGKRISAGQALVELVEAGFQVLLSCRSKLEFALPPFLISLFGPLYFLYENWRIKHDPFFLKETFPPMEGGATKRALRNKLVRCIPEIISVKDGSCIDANGKSWKADLILFATGFQPTLDYLPANLALDSVTGLPPSENMAVKATTGLYLLGFDAIRTFRSRYLRGIREDAPLLAKIIQEYLEESHFVSSGHLCAHPQCDGQAAA
jgi:putative flavoprotein involved in K+ transport